MKFNFVSSSSHISTPAQSHLIFERIFYSSQCLVRALSNLSQLPPLDCLSAIKIAKKNFVFD